MYDLSYVIVYSCVSESRVGPTDLEPPSAEATSSRKRRLDDTVDDSSSPQAKRPASCTLSSDVSCCLRIVILPIFVELL